MGSKGHNQTRRCLLCLSFILTCFVAAPLILFAQSGSSDWQLDVRHLANDGHLDDALHLVEKRLTQYPEDLEAHGWRGRLLSRRGNWQDAEAEYRLVVQKVPQDTEILTSLADVLLWQQKYEESLQMVNRAREIEPNNSEIKIRRARLLFLLNRVSESREQYRSILDSDPTNANARAALTEVAGSRKQDLRIGDEIDFLSYAGNTQSEVITLRSRWNGRWTTSVALNSYQLFGEKSVSISGGAALRFRESDWVRFEAGVAPPQDITPERDVLVEYGHGFHLSNRILRGLESSFQQSSLWYRGAQVVTFGTTQVFYFPHEWLWAVSIIEARTCFPATGCGVVPSGYTKITFPLAHTFSGNLLYGLGTENFAEITQVGRISAHSYGGGIRYRLATNQDLITSLIVQRRQLGQTQISLGITYGIRF
ncbi:MAG: hypothetical protein NVS1B11_31020 [Terriglobales bacterium]